MKMKVKHTRLLDALIQKSSLIWAEEGIQLKVNLVSKNWKVVFSPINKKPLSNFTERWIQVKEIIDCILGTRS